MRKKKEEKTDNLTIDIELPIGQPAGEPVSEQDTEKKPVRARKRRTKNDPPEELPMLMISGAVLFPGVTMHMEVTSLDAVGALYAAATGKKTLFVTCTAVDEDGNETSSYKTGVIANVKQFMRASGGVARAVIEGQVRATRLTDDVTEHKTDDLSYSTVLVTRSPDLPDKLSSNTRDAMLRELKAVFAEYAQLSPKMPKEFVRSIMTSNDPERVFENIAVSIPIPLEEKQTLLEERKLTFKVYRLITALSHEVEILRLQSEMNEKFRDHMSESQREMILREQLRTLEMELGENDSNTADAEEYRTKIEALGLEEKFTEKLLKEADRLNMMPASSPESGVIKGYLDTVLDLPWNTSTKEKADITRVKKQLDADHYGLEKVKERILETIAVRQLSPETKGQIICLYGPPGVGKTSVAKSIAKSLGRSYVRIALGGVRDESDIRGHRRTYIGSMPGRIINGLIEAKSNNPLMLLDEIDKISRDYKGDPSSALLEVLDSEQNVNFRDHYLEIPFDLSKVMFITTANDLSPIDPPLLDRMEVIELSSYTRTEKFRIAVDHLIPKQLEAHGMKKSMLKFTDDAIYTIIDNYTREAGVRQLERVIASLCRKAAKEIIEARQTEEPQEEGKKRTSKRVKITPDNIEKYLGHRKYTDTEAEHTDRVGIVNGLAWTSAGGVIMPLEVLVNDGRGSVQATGSLGEVMQESSRLAVTFVRSIADEYGIDKSFYMDKDIHIHLPEGATPKDGPSAGVTMTTALVSALTDIPVRCDVAMTGEITLHGNVLPIGGLREKTKAAYKEGIKTVIIPKGNKPDLDEIDDEIKNSLNFVFAEKITDVLDSALVKNPAENKKEAIKVGF